METVGFAAAVKSFGWDAVRLFDSGVLGVEGRPGLPPRLKSFGWDAPCLFDSGVLGVEGAGFAAATKGLDRNAARLL